MDELKNEGQIEEEIYTLEVDEALQQTPEDSPSHEPEGEVQSIADSVRSLSPGRLVLKRFFRSKLSWVGLIMIVFLFAFCWIGPLFFPEYIEEYQDRSGAESVYVSETIMTGADGEDYTIYVVQKSHQELNANAAPSLKHWLGTDKDGHDILTRLMYGGRLSLGLCFIVVVLETVLGVILGGLAGYFGKTIDSVIMRVIDIFNCIPSLPLLLIIGALLDGMGVDPEIRIYFMMVFLTLLGWTGVARIVRGQILTLREQEFMTSATARGLSTPRKIFKHLIPNVIPQLIVSMTLGLGSVILMESSLSYMGLGVPLTKASWGLMINDVTDPAILNNFINMWVPPGLCIVAAVLGFNFIGDGLRDAFDPKSRR